MRRKEGRKKRRKKRERKGVRAALTQMRQKGKQPVGLLVEPATCLHRSEAADRKGCLAASHSSLICLVLSGKPPCPDLQDLRAASEEL